MDAHSSNQLVQPGGNVLVINQITRTSIPIPRLRIQACETLNIQDYTALVISKDTDPADMVLIFAVSLKRGLIVKRSAEYLLFNSYTT